MKVTADNLNSAMEETLRRIIAPIGGPIQIRHVGKGLEISLVRLPAIPNYSPKFARVDAIAGDYLTCVWYDPITPQAGSTQFAVAKPYLLQQTPFDGATVTFPGAVQNITYTYDAVNPEWKRSATDGVNTETQVVTPEYWTETDVPCIIRVVAGNTGVLDGSGNRIGWQALSDGRVWAVQ